MVMQTVTCEYCKQTVTKEFKTFRTNRRFCSEECSIKFHNEQSNAIRKKQRESERQLTGKCLNCGKEFVKSKPYQLYCNPKCRGLTSYKKRKGGNKQEIIDINKKAKELGMSYGQYVALQYTKFIKGE